ncbi:MULTISPECIES: nucleoside-diphosphate sugar epimerase/dehydratase [unclassified Nitratiruptor]|uniref:polysaccharide biosynthesis protein n=1 Tax=unclassified Nitratiruptor TaxID=2624044 RepID=UPI0019155EEA|nr:MULTISPECIES: nucleoside-diphosphate sugar epimerase/dehydratase [unclassified Nitratiruptor]BCD60562.1 UDP-N-acetyl-D-glucosamine 4,6-dehydratase [Nitratiruptor sp. YY08-10]BCD64493.1 UDP-N-acetyl-D-glucosamine 4,6-dehydratase [Nitratiruptor sp. YY08-14]
MKLSNLLRPTNFKRALFFLIGDIVISFLTLFISYLLRFNFSIPNAYLNNFFDIAFVLILFKIIFYFYFKFYFISWRFFSLKELKSLVIATTLAYIAAGSILLFFRDFFIPYPRSVIIIDYFLSILFIGFFRVSKRLVLEKISTDKTPAIIIGANEKAISLFKQNIPYSIVAIYDNEPRIVGTYLYGYKINPIKTLETNIKTAIITKELSRKELDKLVEFLQTKGINNIKIYNPFENKIKDVSIEDLLARKPKDLDKKAIERFVKNKKILITGAGGSIGSELCRQCEKYGAKELILVDSCEYNLYAINEELNISRKPYLVNVINIKMLEEIFAKEKPQIVIHAAAYKHVPLCEINPKNAVINNILGTKNTLDLAIKYETQDFILISTDKAVRPTSVMGATKRVCELYAQNIDAKNTKVCAVRFGNVLGSSGSVVPKFKKLIEQDKPLPVTHPEITRYFMLIPEACQLVLQAGSLAECGEIFILDMGEPVKIVDLAKKMLKLYGKDENALEFIGLRPGEKLYEELLLDEAQKETKYKDIFVAKTTFYDINKLHDQIKELLELSNKQEIIKKLKEIVQEFNPKG